MRMLETKLCNYGCGQEARFRFKNVSGVVKIDGGNVMFQELMIERD